MKNSSACLALLVSIAAGCGEGPTGTRLTQSAMVQLSIYQDDASAGPCCATIAWASSWSFRVSDPDPLEYCVAEGAWSGQKSLAGIEYVCPARTSTYKLVCFRKKGWKVADEVTVKPKKC